MSIESQRHRLSKEEVYELIELYQQDKANDEVKEQLVIEYQDLVDALARRFSKGRSIHEDLVQVGMLGLLAAFSRFDPSYGRSFESFAVPTIVGEIKRYIRDKTWSVHVPRRIKELGPRIKRAVEELTIEFQRSPTVDELADYLEVSEEEILETMEMGRSYQALSVDSALEVDQEGSTVTLLELVGKEDDGFETTDRQMLLKKAFRVLSEREQEILNCTYFQNLSQKETGERLGISQMHVSRLQRRALKKLREAIQVEPTECL